MTGVNVIVKPYAKAAYEFAVQNNSVNEWSSMLLSFKHLFMSQDVLDLIDNPAISQADVMSDIQKVCGEQIDIHFSNFLSLIVIKNRIKFLPHIYDMFAIFKQLDINSKIAKVTLAYDSDKELLARLKNKLEQKFVCTIELDVRVDPSIIGGAIVKVDDTVIDNSVSGRLEEMKSILLT